MIFDRLRTDARKQAKHRYAIDREHIGHPDIAGTMLPTKGLSDDVVSKKRSKVGSGKLKEPLPYEIKEVMCVRVRDRRALSAQMRWPQNIANFVYELAQGVEDVEHFWVLLLNKQNVVINYATIGKGSVDSVPVHPRDVFRAAVYMNASAVVIAHNHPSGNNEPSNEDLQITKVLKEASKVLGIQLLDHIIVPTNVPLDSIGNAAYTSLVERGHI